MYPWGYMYPRLGTPVLNSAKVVLKSFWLKLKNFPDTYCDKSKAFLSCYATAFR